VASVNELQLFCSIILSDSLTICFVGRKISQTKKMDDIAREKKLRGEIRSKLTKIFTERLNHLMIMMLTIYIDVYYCVL
jgi:hypothetical protein